MAYSKDDPELDYPQPFLLLTDNGNICQTWESAFTDPNFKKEYDNMSDKDKKTISDNLKTRTCQSIKNVNQCFTIDGEFETCDNLLNENPKSIRKIMSEIDSVAEAKKNAMITEIDQYIEKRRDIIDNLIDNYANRTQMIDMHGGYKTITDESIEKSIEEKNELVEKINRIDNIKNSTTNILEKKRSDTKWYNDKYGILTLFVKILLTILILVEFGFILLIRV